MDGDEDLLIYCLKPNQPCVAGLDQLKWLYYINVVLQEQQDPSETSEELTHCAFFNIHYKKPDLIRP